MRVAARIAAISALAISLAACASSSHGPIGIENTATIDGGVRVEIPSRPLECVPYARAHSAIAIRGDAWTWWSQAAGRYSRTASPQPGAVMVFARIGGPPGGHVAVVRGIVSARVIRVDHANWLGKGRIYLSDPVRDVSPANDWSHVRVCNAETGAWGGRTYPIAGFVGPGPAAAAGAAPTS